MSEIRERVIYYGEVQGVGFRFTAAKLAHGFPVVGTVRNLPNGTVELIVQGPKSAVLQFQLAFAAIFAGKITEVLVEDEVVANELRGFQILR